MPAHHAMDAYSTIVVPLDLEFRHDRAVPIAQALATVGEIPIQLVTVSSPGLAELPDQYELERTAKKHQLVGRWSPIVLHDNQPARAIASHLATLDAPLVVMASSVHGVIREIVWSDIAAHLLSETACPALIVGPSVPDAWRPSRPQLLVCIDPTSGAEVTAASMTRWLGTFGGDAPRFVTVIGSEVSSPDDDARAAAQLQVLADEFTASSGFGADCTVLHDDDPAEGLLALVKHDDDLVFMVVSERWPDGARAYRHSVSRHLARSSATPVLVVRPSPKVRAF